MGMRPMWDNGIEDFFRPFVAEICAAKHEERRDHLRKEIAQGQGTGKQDEDLLRSDPSAILPTIGNSRSATKPTT